MGLFGQVKLSRSEQVTMNQESQPWGQNPQAAPVKLESPCKGIPHNKHPSHSTMHTEKIKEGSIWKVLERKGFRNLKCATELTDHLPINHPDQVNITTFKK